MGDAPGVTNAATTEETQTTTGLVLTRSASDGAEITHFKITTITNGTLFQHDGTTPIADTAVITAAEGNAGLRFTPAAEFSGTATFVVQAATSVAGAGAGASTTALITVAPVADTPSITSATTQVNAQTTSGLVIAQNAADGAEVTHVKIVSVANGTLFQHDGTTPIPAGTFITIAQANAGLRFTPLADSLATGQVTVRASLGNTDADLGGGRSDVDHRRRHAVSARA